MSERKWTSYTSGKEITPVEKNTFESRTPKIKNIYTLFFKDRYIFFDCERICIQITKYTLGLYFIYLKTNQWTKKKSISILEQIKKNLKQDIIGVAIFFRDYFFSKKIIADFRIYVHIISLIA